MNRFRPQMRPLAPADLPFDTCERAWALGLEHMPECPGWTRLPQRSFLESPTVEVCEGFPGVIFENDGIYIDEIWERDTLLEKLYIAYLGEDVTYGRISPEYAACLGALIPDEEMPSLSLPDSVLALRGQVLGPLTWALQVLDQDGSPILYNEGLLDVVPKHLHLKAAWQAHVLRQFAPVSIVLVEEPLMTAVGLSSLPVEKDRALILLQDVLKDLPGLKGIHCSYPVDPTVFDLSANVLSLDVSHISEPSQNSLDALRGFFKRGGFLVWGIVPADERLDGADVDEMSGRLQHWLESLAPNKEDRKGLIATSMVSTAGGLADLDEIRAELALSLVAGVSRTIRAECGLG